MNELFDTLGLETNDGQFLVVGYAFVICMWVVIWVFLTITRLFFHKQPFGNVDSRYEMVRGYLQKQKTNLIYKQAY